MSAKPNIKSTAENSIGPVETKFYTFAQPPHEFPLESGASLGPITLAYETYGTLNKDKSNAIIIFHTLTMDAHAAGTSKDDKKPGWWDPMIGPGKAFDTNKYFMISVNVLGGCKGSTGPSSIDPKTGKPYGLNFPVITIKDMVETQRILIREHLGIKKILCLAGGSMGGLQALQWGVSYPDEIASVIAIAANARQTAQQIALHEVGRQAIMKDPDWQGGNYYGKTIPGRGLGIARMMGHITYMSDKSMEEKFGRKLFSKEKFGYDFSHEFEVENYLKYRSDSFIQRFDANSYLYISKALDYFDLAPDGDLAKAFRNIKASFLVIAFTSDWLYPPYQSKDMVKALKTNDIDVSYCEVESDYGHDAFLVEVDGQSRLIEHYLKRIQKEISR
ncbi:MAG: homoserine O-acetyltransferase [Candidatus Omnitrophota bacterium]